VPLGFAIGAVGTLVGAGGGFLLVPFLLLLYPDRDADAITSMSLFFVLLNSASGALAYARQRRIDYRTAFWLSLGTLPGAIGGALVVGQVPRSLFEGVFAAVLVLLAAYLLLRRDQTGLVEPVSGRWVSRRLLRDAFGNTFVYSFKLWQGVALAAATGFFGALLGIGGGVVNVPMMTVVLHFPTHIAVATSQLVVGAMAGQSTAVHIASGTLGWNETLGQASLLALGALPGAQVGARLARRIQGQVITRVLAISLLLVGLRLALAAFGV
jgi:hypothetical protein